MKNSYLDKRLFSDSIPHYDASEDIFRLLKGPNRLFAIFSTTTEGKITTWSKGAEKLFKVSRFDMVGRSSSILFSPDSWLSFLAMISNPDKLALGGEVKQFLFKITESDSIQIHVAVSRSMVKNTNEITMVLVLEGYFEPELSFPDMAEILFRSNGGCAKLLDTNGRVQAMNPVGRCLMEVEDFAAIQGKIWSDFWPDNSKPVAIAAVKTALAGGSSSFQGYCPTLKGELHNWRVEVHPVKNPQGMVVQILAISTPQSDEIDSVK